MSTEASMSASEAALRDAAREYHRSPVHGKIEVTPTKPLVNQRDLSLAYSPGVAWPCLDIQADPAKAAEYTARGNLVGVVTNGTAVLGLGDIGPLAGKPVMEGKGCLFKKFAGIDVFDIELAERDPDKLVEIIAALEPTLGGINLEDIKAPECFYIEQQLRNRMQIPVFHDDQHGTAIISSSALLNGLELVGKQIDRVKLAVSGAGAAALACLDLMVELGVRRDNIYVCDSKGLIYEDRPAGYDASKARYAQPDTGERTLADVVAQADVFLGCSTANVLSAAMVQSMAAQPIILALANPDPEIRPEIAHAARPDCIMATGRSDYPNQVNNVLCFPYIFRGALDCGATRITEAMKLACVREIAALAKMEISDEVASAYVGQDLRFGADYLIPKPFDSRLILRIAPAVAQAAADSGVATRPIADMQAYRDSLDVFVTQTGLSMRPVFQRARQIADADKRVIYADGEDERVLRAAQLAHDDGIAHPILIGRRAEIEAHIQRLGLHMKLGEHAQVFDVAHDARLPAYVATTGLAPEAALAEMRCNPTLVAALALKHGDADAMVCGLPGGYEHHLEVVQGTIGTAPGARFAALNALMLDKQTLFIADTYVNENPDAEALAHIALQAAQEVRYFGLVPRVAFLARANYGDTRLEGALKMRQAATLFRQLAPDVDCDGDLQGDAALSLDLRQRLKPDSSLQGRANVLICPSLDAANILFNVLKVTAGNGLTIGPMLLGAAASVHILTPSATMRRVLNQTALAVVAAQAKHK